MSLEAVDGDGRQRTTMVMHYRINYGWADVLSRSCGGALWDIKVHVCANNPCGANHPYTKHGLYNPRPIHLQPSDWRPPAAHVSPAAVAAGEAGSAGVENGEEGEEIIFAGVACIGGDLKARRRQAFLALLGL